MILTGILFFSLSLVAQAEGGLTCFDVVCPSQKYDKAVSCTVGKHERLFDVELKKELSNTECVGNLNYSVTENSIRVLKGCRAVFHVCTETNNPKTNTETVLCSSSGEYQQCKGDLSEREVIDYHLIEEYSTSKCVRDVTFGSVLDSLWVDEGCQGMFSIATIPECVDVTCSSARREAASCSLPPPYTGRQIYHSNVTERISKTSCKRRSNRHYSPDKNAVWAYSGCQAEMNVCTMPEAAECTVIKCVGKWKNKRHCTVTDSRDKLIIHIAAEKIRPQCEEGKNYGYEDGAVWVSGKCNGYFRICMIAKKPQLQAPVTQLSRPTQYYEDSGTTGHCQSNTCQNNGVCVNTTEGYRCKCPFDFFGNHCELNNGNCIHVECSPRSDGRTYCALLTSEKPLTINHDEDSPNCTLGWTYGYDPSIHSIWATSLCQGHFTLCSVPRYAKCEWVRCTQSEVDTVCPYKERENVIAVYPDYADSRNCQSILYTFFYLSMIRIGNEHCASRAKVCWNPGKVVCQQVNCSSESGLVEHCSLNPENLFNIREVSITSVEPGSSCHERVNYGYSENAIWVSNGCSAVFSACGHSKTKHRRRKYT